MHTGRALALLALLALGGLGAISLAQEMSLEDRLHALRAEGVVELDGLLGQAERATREVRRREGDGEARAHAIADGALSVAEARVALRAARAEVATLERDLAHVRARRERSLAALEAARRTREQGLPEPEPLEGVEP